MPDIALPMPSDPVSPAPVDPEQGAAARRLAFAIGPMLQAADGTLVAADLLAVGGALALARRTNLRSIDEAFEDTAVQILSELERDYGIAVRTDLTVAQRQARLVATVRALISGAPDDIQTSVRALDPTATVVEVGIVAALAAEPNPAAHPTWWRAVFRFALSVSAATYTDASLVEQIDSVVQKMKPGYTTYTLTVGTAGFLCDDPGSLTDRDVLAE